MKFSQPRGIPCRLPNWKALLSSLGLILLAGCGETGEVVAPVAVDPWARPATVEFSEDGIPTPANSAVYLILRNSGASSQLLLGVESPAAETVEVHESVLEGDVMRMRKVDRLELPEGGEVELRPGGLHLMLLGLRRSLEVGDTLSLTLFFQGSGTLELSVPVKNMGGS